MDEKAELLLSEEQDQTRPDQDWYSHWYCKTENGNEDKDWAGTPRSRVRHRHSSQLKAWHKSSCDLYWVFPPAAHILHSHCSVPSLSSSPQFPAPAPATHTQSQYNSAVGPAKDSAKMFKIVAGPNKTESGKKRGKGKLCPTNPCRSLFHAHARCFILQCCLFIPLQRVYCDWFDVCSQNHILTANKKYI